MSDETVKSIKVFMDEQYRKDQWKRQIGMCKHLQKEIEQLDTKYQSNREEFTEQDDEKLFDLCEQLEYEIYKLIRLKVNKEPLGYVKEMEKLFVQEDEASIVKFLHELYVRNETAQSAWAIE